MRSRPVLLGLLIAFLVALVIGGAVGWTHYRRTRAEYDQYRTLIQAGTRVAGIDVGWRTPSEARELVEKTVAEPYYREFILDYQGASSTPMEVFLSVPVVVFTLVTLTMILMILLAYLAVREYSGWTASRYASMFRRMPSKKS